MAMHMKKDCVVPLLDTKFIKVYDLQYEQGKHYYDATRRNSNNLIAIKTDEELKQTMPDAVSCVIVLDVPGQETKMCVMKEYRYPTGRFVLSVPSGLIDEEDQQDANPILQAAIREMQEETGLTFDAERDEAVLVNPLLFCSPGMTDESTAVMKLTLHRQTSPSFSEEGAVGTEVFEEETWITKEEAKAYLRKGCDENGIYYSAITWIALMTFVSEIW